MGHSRRRDQMTVTSPIKARSTLPKEIALWTGSALSGQLGTRN